MPSTKPQLKAITDEITYKKIKVIAERENRSVSNLIETLVKEKIKNFENENGSIAIQKTINMGDNHGTINM